MRGVGVNVAGCILVGGGVLVTVFGGAGVGVEATAAGVQAVSKKATIQRFQKHRAGVERKAAIRLIVSEKEPCEGFEPSQG